jgi:hypothetical protein
MFFKYLGCLVGVVKKFKRFMSGDVQIGKNPLFLGTFWGILKTSKKEKGPEITILENFI